MDDSVILVDLYDHEKGISKKIDVHEKGLLHRAFSIFIFNNNGELLMQRRAINKYHSGGLWTNTCCSHPNANSPIQLCMKNRLQDELGITVNDFEEKGQFVYFKMFNENLFEYEYDHVYVGHSNEKVIPNEKEVMEFKWVSIDNIVKDAMEQPKEYTAWFITALSIVLN